MKRHFFIVAAILQISLMGCHFRAESGDQQKSIADKRSSNDIPEVIRKQKIIVDGTTDDWAGITAYAVNSKDHLWLGEGLPEGAWKGPDDFSFSFKTAWYDGNLYFLIEVTDDVLSNFDQEYAWLNDCIEIHLDPLALGGERIEGIGLEHSLEDRFGRNLRGYEMQFLPSDPPKAFVDDTRGVYYTDKDQTDYFKEVWNGEMVAKKTETGYLMEIGFNVPGVDFQSGHQIGLDVAVCDDDGDGRKSLLIWSGYKGAFWLTMDNFIRMVLE